MFDRLDTIHPAELLALTEVKDGEAWHSLAFPQNIDRYVRDVLGALRPHEALAAIMNLVKQYSFGFKAPKVNVPHRFRTETEEKDDPGGMRPVLSWLYTEGKATMRELQKDYTLEDAFRKHRELLKAKVKAALETEAAQKKAKAKGG
ncbi:hypothetical protein VSR34_37290 [Paraburkholderia sp. JHI2823]|uniref:hypothetical protein n=1 Tax=Paraburkholderia TaxID=1822464 RepID=UPI00047FE870|nr:hypothetical protein [Paraburkholderia mimosarum]